MTVQELINELNKVQDKDNTIIIVSTDDIDYSHISTDWELYYKAFIIHC